MYKQNREHNVDGFIRLRAFFLPEHIKTAKKKRKRKREQESHGVCFVHAHANISERVLEFILAFHELRYACIGNV